MRGVAFLAIALAIMSLLAMMPAREQFGAGSVGIPFVTGPCFTFAEPFALGAATIVFANQSALAHDFTGSFALAFPEVHGLSPGSPSVFSPVIAQTTSESIAASRSYFFADFIIA
jgi:hypothetical protein